MVPNDISVSLSVINLFQQLQYRHPSLIKLSKQTDQFGHYRYFGIFFKYLIFKNSIELSSPNLAD